MGRTPAIRRSNRRSRRAPRASTSAPTTACCMRSTTRPAMRRGPTFRASCSAAAWRAAIPRRAWARFPIRTAHFRRSSTTSMSMRRLGSSTSTSLPRPLARIGEPSSSADSARAAIAYYALDVTDPAAITSEAAATGKALWEFTDPDMGYSYGKPMITKTHAFGGAWVVILATGYNNPSGVGKIYFVRASDGSLLKTMSTGAGTPGTPSGLAHPSGYTQDFRNQVVEQVYAGDLLGQLLALRRLRPESGELDGRPARQFCRSERRRAAGHDAAADRNRLQQRRRPLGVRRHRQAVRRLRSGEHADRDDVCAARWNQRRAAAAASNAAQSLHGAACRR